MHFHRLLQPLALAAVFAAGIGSASAQTFSLNWNPRSGDVWVDSQLADMNRYGSQYRDPFIDEMVRYNSAPRDLVTELLVQRRWAPGDVYYACSIARIASGVFIARSIRSEGPNMKKVTNTPAARKATSFTIDSVATASIRPC